MHFLRRKPKRSNLLIESFGWLGVITTIGAYAAISLGALSPLGFLYPSLNLFAGLALGIETYTHRDFQPFWLNVIWGGIALLSLLRLIMLSI